MAPDLTVISFPAWDCLPCDRASPHRDILARRIDALSRLSAMEEGARKLVVVTTVAAILQRVPTPAGFKGTLELKRGRTARPGQAGRIPGRQGLSPAQRHGRRGR